MLTRGTEQVSDEARARGGNEFCTAAAQRPERKMVVEPVGGNIY